MGIPTGAALTGRKVGPTQVRVNLRRAIAIDQDPENMHVVLHLSMVPTMLIVSYSIGPDSSYGFTSNIPKLNLTKLSSTTLTKRVQ